MSRIFCDETGCRFMPVREDGILKLLPVADGEAREIPETLIRRVERCAGGGKTGLWVTLDEEILHLTAEGDVPVEEFDALFPGLKVEDSQREGEEELKQMGGCLVEICLIVLIPLILSFVADWLLPLYWIALCICMVVMQVKGAKACGRLGFGMSVYSLYRNMPAVCLPDYRQLALPVLGVTVLMTLLFRLVMWKRYSMKRLLGLMLLTALLFAPGFAIWLNTLHPRPDRAHVSTAEWEIEKCVPLIDIYRVRFGDEVYYMNESFVDDRRRHGLAVRRTGWLGIDYLEPEYEAIQKSSPRSG